MHKLDALEADFDFLAPLRRARLYSVARSVILALLWSLTASVLVFELAPLFSQMSGRAVEPGGTSLFVLVTTLVIGLSLALGRPPDLIGLARRADRRYGLGERLSTAIGITPGSSGRRGAINAALRRDAAWHAAQVDPRRLAPLFDRAVGIAALALAAAIGVALLAPMVPTAPTPQPAVTASLAVDPQTRADNLKTIADILAADADERGNDYLRQVAEAVQRLAAQPGLPADEYRDELTGLLDNARLAYGKTAPGWLLQDLAAPGDKYGLLRDSQFATLAQRATAANIPDPMAGSGEELVPELLSERNLQHEPGPAPLPGQLRLAPQDDNDLATSAQNIGGNPAGSDPLSGQARPGMVGGAPPALGDTDAAASDNGDAVSAILAGGATQSGQGASRTAGQGTQALDDPTRAAAPSKPGSDEVLLPTGQYKQGKRIRVQVTPPTGSATTLDAQGHVVAADGTIEPAPVTRDTPSLRDQAIFSRFFTHDEAGDGA